MARQKTLVALQEQVGKFNEAFKVGSKLKMKIGGASVEVTVKEQAIVLQKHSAVAWFEELGGACYSIEGVIYS